MSWFWEGCQLVAQREWRGYLHRERTAKLWQRILWIGIYFLLVIVPDIVSSLTASYLPIFDPQYVQIKFSLLGTIFLYLMPGITAASITRERELQRLDFLLLTRLSGLQIVLGKLLAPLRVLPYAMAYPLAMAVPGVILNHETSWKTVLVLISIPASIVLTSALGLYVSSHFRRTNTAQVVTLSIIVFYHLFFSEISRFLTWSVVGGDLEWSALYQTSIIFCSLLLAGVCMLGAAKRLAKQRARGGAMFCSRAGGWG